MIVKLFSISALLLSGAVALSACNMAGEIVSPGDLTPAERCTNAQMILAFAKANLPADHPMLIRLERNVDVLCSMVPPDVAARAKEAGARAAAQAAVEQQ